MPTVTLLEEDRRGEWDPLIGATVGSWRIARKLGAGGMGAVFLARHPGIGARVAIKFLHSRYQSDRAAVERFFNEARAVNLIGHENIVKILDFNVLPDGRRYFVMEFLEGRSLQSLLDAKQAVPLSVAGPIVLQICRALQAAHERGITHRDLKPENVFLVSQMGRKHFVKLVDFGIAKLEPQGAQQGGAVTETGVVMGTPAYMSPEQAAGRIGEIGRRSDVYSLGVVMYQLATGRVPFEGPSTAETLVKHLQERPRPPRELEQSVPAEYEAVILKALEKKREDRFQSMKELHDALRACMKALGVSEELPVDDGPPAPPELDDETGPVPEGAQRPLPVPGTQTSAGPLTLGGRVVEAAEWAVAPERRMKIAAGVLGVIVLVGMVGISREQKHAHEIDKALEPVKAATRTGAQTQTQTQTPTPTQTQTPTPTPTPTQTPTPTPTPTPTQTPTPAPKASHSAPPAKPSVNSKHALPPPGAPRPAAPKLAAPKPVVQRPAPTTSPARPAPVEPPQDPSVAPTAADTARAAKKARDDRDAAAKAIQQMQDAAAQTAASEAGQTLPSAKLYVVTDPLGATVTAAWNGKSAAGQTPFVFKVRRGAQVTVTVSKTGFVPSVQQVDAKVTQAVVVHLKPDAR